MNTTNIINYVRGACDPIPDEKFFRTSVKGTVLMSLLCGVFQCFILKGWWLFIALALILNCIIGGKIVYKVSSEVITHERCLVLKIATCFMWIIGLSFLELLYFSLWKCFHISILLLYTPIVIIPLLMGLYFHKKLKNKNQCKSKSTAPINLGITGFTSGILGTSFAAIFRDVDQATAIIIGNL